MSDELGDALATVQAHRPRLEREIKTHGTKRAQYLERADAELAEIAALARQAVAAGTPIARVADLAGVTRKTMYRLLET